MDIGTHDTRDMPDGWQPPTCVEGHRGCYVHTSRPRPRTDADLMAMRGEVPPGWVRLPGGGIVPPALAGRMSGWVDDRTVEPGKAATLAGLYARMDELSAEVAEYTRTGVAERLIASAVGLATVWRKISKEVQS